jgi:hypothetical protein
MRKVLLREPKMGRKITLKSLLLLLAVLLSPAICCSGTFLLEILPISNPLDFFGTELRVENRTDETVTITPVTTTTGAPQIIMQPGSVRQRDFPLPPGGVHVLSYDAADAPLAGIAVCVSGAECRLLETGYGEDATLDVYAELPPLPAAWQAELQSTRERNFAVLLFPLLGVLPIIFFAGWVLLSWRDRRSSSD